MGSTCVAGVRSWALDALEECLAALLLTVGAQTDVEPARGGGQVMLQDTLVERHVLLGEGHDFPPFVEGGELNVGGTTNQVLRVRMPANLLVQGF